MKRKDEQLRVAVHYTGSTEVVYQEAVNPLPDSKVWSDIAKLLPDKIQRIVADQDLEPFTIRNGRPFTKEDALAWIQAVAGAYEVPELRIPAVRKQRIIAMLNRYFIKVNTNGVPHVGMILPSVDNAMRGRMILSQKPADAWLKSTAYEVLFSIECPGGYTKHHEDDMRALFGAALVTASNKADERTGKGRPPKRKRKGKESEEGEHMQDVWDAHLPVRVKEGRSVKQIAVNLAKMWYNSPNARNCEGTYFRPLLDDPDHGFKLNLFEGWTWSQEEVKGEFDRQERISLALAERVPPIHEPTAVDMWCNHVEEVMANGNEEFGQWLHYFAWHLLMRPAEPWEGVPVIVGVQGCGKNNWFKVLEGIIGQQMTMVTARMDDVVGNFTDRLENKMLLLLDEAKRDNGANIGSYMKVLVTDLQYRLRKMYHPVSFADKYFRIVVFSNYEDVLEVEPGERRYFLMRCSARYKGVTQYHKHFVELCHSEEGMKAIYDWYAHHFDWRTAHEKFQSGRVLIRTELLMDQQLSSMPPHFRWLYDALFAGELVSANRLMDAKDPQLSELRRALKRNAEDIAADFAAKGKTVEAANWRAEAHSRSSWEQVLSVNDIYRSYLYAFKRLNGRGPQKSINQLLHTLQELLGGHAPVFHIPLMRKDDITKLASRHDHEAFVRVQQGNEGESLNEYGDVRQPTIATYFKTSAVPQSDYYVILPILKVCQDNFCEHFGFKDNIWESFQDAAMLNRELSARLEQVPVEATQEQIYKGRDDALNKTFGFMPVGTPEEIEEWEKYRAYIMGTK